jgi:phospholipid/cholesterol/gamma-HCH transport system substrate-binding protein
MRRAIREHLRDFVAIAVLLVLAIVTTGVILVQQSANFPSWVPILGTDHFELKAEFTTAQAVTPGQGQQITIAGIKVGTVGGVKLENGAAVVTMDIDNKYARLIHPDATLLLRPRTGLQDMTIEVDPGTDTSEVKEGSTIPLAQTQPNVQPDQILASLDADTRSYLQLLLQAAGEGLRGQNGPKLAASLKRFEPTARDLAKIGGALAKRRENLRRVITNFGKISQQLGHSDTQLAGFVRSSNDVLGSFAHQEAAIRQTLQELPATLKTTRASLESGDRLAQQLGPASRRLIPAAQAFGPAMRQIRPLFRQTTGPIHHQIRPFARAVRKPLGALKKAANPLTRTSTGLASALKKINMGLNALAYNPPGSAQEGYLFWLGWLNHDTNALFFTQDAGGPLRHGIVLQSCQLAVAAELVAASDADVKTLLQLSGVAGSPQIAMHQSTCIPFGLF